MGWTNPPSQGGGPFGGINPPPFQTGKYYWPHYLAFELAFTLTANRLYRYWFYVPKTTTFLGAWIRNTGTGDTGVVIRTGAWSASGALLKDFGVITLGATAVMNTAANSLTVSGPAWIQIGMVSSGTPAIMAAKAVLFASGTGASVPNILANQLGSFPAGLAGGATDIAQNTPVGDYAAFSYAAMPDPITVATATVYDATSGNGNLPMMGLYL